MKYLCLVYGEAKKLDAMPKSESDALTRESLAYDDELRRSGHYLHSHALQSVDAAASVQVRNGDVSITDGPFAETKEQLLGFILIEAEDRDDAVKAASGIPLARYGTIEVRPILDLRLPQS